jgi:cation transport regulator ChaC
VNRVLLITVSFCFIVSGLFARNAEESTYWDKAYERTLLQKVGVALPELATFPSFQYPNDGHQKIVDHFPSKKVLLFGYGSLMNKVSAARSVKAEAVESMEPSIAFGVKRLFNYKVTDPSRWGAEQHRKERAVLNIAQTLNIGSMVNGVVLEVDAEDLTKLVSRETGYDLVPILVASWDDVMNQKSEIEVRVAYVFIAVNELRNNIAYTSTEYYPVLGYLHAVQEASQAHGHRFATFWNRTTYLANGTTQIESWDQVTFTGILCTQRP